MSRVVPEPIDPREDLSRMSRRGQRAAAAARERKIALVSAAVVVVLAVFGALVWPALSAKGVAHSAVPTVQLAKATQKAARASKPAASSTAKKRAARSAAARAKTARAASRVPAKVAVVHVAAAPAPKRRVVAAVPARATKVVHAAKASPARKTKAPGAAAVKAAAAHAASAGTITIVTFGYNFAGPPSGARFLADVRNISAGSFLQTENGLMASVRARVMAAPAAQVWLAHMQGVWLPQLKAGDMVAIGCARGHHRSVTLAYLFAQDLRAKGFKVNLVNRDIYKTF